MSLLKPGCTMHGYDKNLFCERKSNIFQNVDSRIHHLSRNFDIKGSSCGLKETTVKQHLKDLHCKNVTAPIGKTKGNVKFICQRFYVPVIVEEFTLLNNNNNTNQTSKQVSNSNINLINNHSNTLKSIFNTNLDDIKR